MASRTAGRGRRLSHAGRRCFPREEAICPHGAETGGSARGAWYRAARAGPTGSGFLPPPPRSVHAFLPHTAHRRPSPPAFGFPLLARQSLKGLVLTHKPLTLTNPLSFVVPYATTD